MTTAPAAPQPTPAGLSPDAIEGRLTAHRTVLALILAELQRTGHGQQVLERLDSLSVVQDHQEDPGAAPGGAEVIQGSEAQEIRAVLLEALPDRSMPGESG
jgi:hypothetical protein